MRLHALVLLACAPLSAQTVIPSGTPPSYGFDGRVDEWRGLPPTFSLSASKPGARNGSVWVRQIPEGLLIAGEVDGPAPDFAANSADLPRKDHVEIWIAPPTQPRFPPIGYGEQSQEVPTIDGCGEDKKCRAWFQSVVVHRRLMARTFVRQFSMSPSVALEGFARPAYDRMLATVEKNFQDDVAALAPNGTAVFQSARGAAGGYSFEALVPWESFPPFDSLELRKLRLMVDVYSAHVGELKDQPYSSTSPVGKSGFPPSFNAVVLEAGRHFRITACGYSLVGLNKAGESGPAVFFPRREDDITRVFRLRNFEPIYSYYLSPYTETTDFVEKPVNGNAVVCGPRLAIARNNKVERFPVVVDQSTLDVKFEPDGSYLLLSGPAWKRATKYDEDGCCEGLPMLHYHVWVVSPAGKIRQIFESHVLMSGIAEGIVDFDAEASPDAKNITTFVQWFSHAAQSSSWNSTTYCRQGMQYRECGHNLDSPGPKKKTNWSAK